MTLFGIVDAGYASVKNGSTATAASTSKSGITNSGLNSSRLGFRGVEDLGGGLKAGFWLETALANDDNTTSVNFARRSTVSLMGGFGEVRIGRDYTPTFWNTTVYDPFGTNGIGQASTPALIGSSNTTAVRANNSVSYFTPAMGGFSGQVMVAFGENAQTSGTTTVKTGNYMGLRAGYAAGPLSVHVASGKLNGATAAADVKTTNLGASYDLGMVKPFLFVGQEKNTGTKVSAVELGATAPVGAGTVRVAFSKYDPKLSPTVADTNEATKFAVGYVYDLSKRTSVYGTFAQVSNKGLMTMSVANNGLSNAAANPGGKSTGYEVGVKHAF